MCSYIICKPFTARRLLWTLCFKILYRFCTLICLLIVCLCLNTQTAFATVMLEWTCFLQCMSFWDWEPSRLTKRLHFDAQVSFDLVFDLVCSFWCALEPLIKLSKDNKSTNKLWGKKTYLEYPELIGSRVKRSLSGGEGQKGMTLVRMTF